MATNAWIDLPPFSGSVSGTVNANIFDSFGGVLNSSGGALDVNVVSSTPSKTIKQVFNSITSVPSLTETTILSFTVAPLTTDYLGQIEVSGNNVAQFNVYLNSTLFSRQRTYFGGALNLLFNYDLDLENGYPLSAGDVLEVKVIQDRPSLGDYEARILYAE